MEKDKLKLLVRNHKIKNMQNVLTAVSYVNSIDEELILDKSRLRPYVDARRLCYVLTREIYGYAYQSIARFFNKNHATIIHQIEVHATLMEYDKSYADKYLEIKNSLIDDSGFSSNSVLMKEKSYYLNKIEEINSKLLDDDKD